METPVYFIRYVYLSDSRLSCLMTTLHGFYARVESIFGIFRSLVALVVILSRVIYKRRYKGNKQVWFKRTIAYVHSFLTSFIHL